MLRVDFVLADSGYDAKDIEKTIASKKWYYIITLKKKRTVKTVKIFENTTKSKGWLQVAILFKKYRCLKWSTVRVPVNSTRKKRMEFRVRPGFEIWQKWPEAVMHSCGSCFVHVPKNATANTVPE